MKEGVNIMPQVHNLKTWTPFFKDVKCGVKQFEVRKNDRDFQIGDTLILEEFNPDTEKYTGAWAPMLVTYMLKDERFVKDGFVILGIKEIKF
jgi:hypothetical protein